VRLQVVELDTDRGKIESRLKARERSASEISDARLEDLEKLNAAYEAPSELEPDLIKISADNSVYDTVKAVLQQLAEKQLC
jgi:thymidylate kinase